MKVLFHVGVGNSDRPNRWSFINKLFTDLANVFELFGHSSIVWYHPAATIGDKVYKTNLSSAKIEDNIDKAIAFDPDWVFTWNGVSEGDQLITQQFGKKVIYGELGFFDHYKTCHFDFWGVNSLSRLLVEDLPEYNNEEYQQLVEKYKKPNAYNSGDYIFVPLQDENDRQVKNFSPITRMGSLFDYVEENYSKENIPILYKRHPHYPMRMEPRDNFYEVTGDVHGFIPYARKVVGINSTVLFETLLYHNRMEAVGKGIMSRELKNDEDRKRYIMHCKSKQFYFDELKNTDVVKNSYFYKEMTRA